MIVVNETLLERFRQRIRCEYCRAKIPKGEPHHVWAKGIGGAFRLDIPENLIALCPNGYGGNCHRKFHDGHIPKSEIVKVIAAREGKTPREIEEIVNRYRHQLSGKDQAPMSVTYHPVANLFPRLDPAALQDLEDSIKELGVLHPVAFWSDLLVEGRHRWEVATKLGIECPRITLKGDEADAIAYAIATNIRRDMPREAKLVAITKAKLMQAEAANARKIDAGKENLKKIKEISPSGCKIAPTEETQGKPQKSKTNQEIASAAGVSERKAQHAINVVKKSPEEIVAAVAASEVSVSDAAEVADLPADEQLDALEKVKSGKARTLKAAAKKEEKKDEEKKDDFLWDRRGRLIFDPECIKKYKASAELRDRGEKIKEILHGLGSLENVILGGKGQGQHGDMMHGVWVITNYHPGFVCPVCYGTGLYSEERIDYILETVELLKTDKDAYSRLEHLPNGDKCESCLGVKWKLADAHSKVDEEVIFAKHCPRRTDAYRRPVK